MVLYILVRFVDQKLPKFYEIIRKMRLRLRNTLLATREAFSILKSNM